LNFQYPARKTASNPKHILWMAMLFLLGTTLWQGCKLSDTNKLKKAWHNLISRDNIWFNADEKMRLAKQQLRSQQEDNFDKILEIYPYGSVAQRKGLEGEMDAVISKSTKIINKHRISKWVDDSYLLVGQAQFFKGEYYAAVETFQYINFRFKNSPLKPQATLWIIKCLIYMGKIDDAEAAYTVLKNDPQWPKNYIGDLDGIGTQINIVQGKYQTASHLLRSAIEKTNILQRYEKARYSYILAQLYQKLEMYDSANYFFKKVIKYNPPYDMAFNAKMNLAKAYNVSKGSEARKIKRQLKNMLRDDKNISFYDQIYYELGLISLKEKNIPEAIANFKLSASSSQKNNAQKALAYRALADLYFSQRPKPDYRNAQAYFDSTALFIPKEHPEYSKILEKKEVLGELIKNLLIIDNEDSLQKLADIPEGKLDKALDQIIEAQKTAKLNKTAVDGAGLTLNPNTSDPNGQSWFTNSTQLAMGAAEFSRKWGDRKNVDYWKYAAKAAEQQNATTSIDDPKTTQAAIDSADEASNDPLKEKKIYKDASPEKKQILNAIPFTERAKKESDKKIAQAMCDNGVIYYERINDLLEAEEVFKTLMLRYSDFEQMDKVLYYLYKIETELKSTAEADKYKQMLLEKYPKSNYAKILGKNFVSEKSTEKNKEVIQLYEQLYGEFAKGNYSEVKKMKPEADKRFPGNGLQPKFDFLYALAVGKTDSLSKYEMSLKLVESKYPNTEEGDKSHRLLEAIERFKSGKLNKVDENKEEMKEEIKKEKPKGDYKSQYASRYFYIMVLPANNFDVNTVKNSLSDLNSAKHTLEGLEGRMMLFDDAHQLYRIVEFKDKNAAVAYVKEIEGDADVQTSMNLPELIHFAITEDNFRILYNTKDLDGYLEFYKKSF
jgi:tetratricopeptide (TPR) repeat protein